MNNKKIYTSYYTKAAKLDEDDFVFVQISLSSPKWFPHNLVKFLSLAPTWDLLNSYKSGEIEFEEQYDKKYYEILNSLDKNKIIVKLNWLKEKTNKNIVLLCWEKDRNECHRSLLANWLDIGVIEYDEKDFNRKNNEENNNTLRNNVVEEIER